MTKPHIFCFTHVDMNSGIEWNSTVKKEARGMDDDDLGEIQGITDTDVITKLAG